MMDLIQDGGRRAARTGGKQAHAHLLRHNGPVNLPTVLKLEHFILFPNDSNAKYVLTRGRFALH